MTPEDRGSLHAIVLAAGEGRRLLPLTRALHGADLPKQFAVIDGERSLLQETLARIAPLVPETRTTVVVAAAHEELARRQLAATPAVEIVVQPRPLDTAPGICLPLAHVLARAPDATIAIFPSDHHVPRPRPLLRAVAAAADAIRRGTASVTLLGVVPDRPETEYGWIVPGAAREGGGLLPLAEVARFVEKPAPALARHLRRRGALWNTFVTVADGAALWQLVRRRLPRHVARFDAYRAAIGTPAEAEVRAAVYQDLPSANFSTEVLAASVGLTVLSVVGSGWSDWGNPERVLASLAGTTAHDALLARMRRPAAGVLAGA